MNNFPFVLANGVLVNVISFTNSKEFLAKHESGWITKIIFCRKINGSSQSVLSRVKHVAALFITISTCNKNGR